MWKLLHVTEQHLCNLSLSSEFCCGSLLFEMHAATLTNYCAVTFVFVSTLKLIFEIPHTVFFETGRLRFENFFFLGPSVILLSIQTEAVTDLP